MSQENPKNTLNWRKTKHIKIQLPTVLRGKFCNVQVPPLSRNERSYETFASLTGLKERCRYHQFRGEHFLTFSDPQINACTISSFCSPPSKHYTQFCVGVFFWHLTTHLANGWTKHAEMKRRCSQSVHKSGSRRLRRWEAAPGKEAGEAPLAAEGALPRSQPHAKRGLKAVSALHSFCSESRNPYFFWLEKRDPNAALQDKWRNTNFWKVGIPVLDVYIRKEKKSNEKSVLPPEAPRTRGAS